MMVSSPSTVFATWKILSVRVQRNCLNFRHRVTMSTSTAVSRSFKGVYCGLVLSLIGCQMDESSFQERFSETYCEVALTCFDDTSLDYLGWEDAQTCIATVWMEDLLPFSGNDDCVFDAEAASSCLSGLRALAKSAECETLIFDETLPNSCWGVCAAWDRNL